MRNKRSDYPALAELQNNVPLTTMSQLNSGMLMDEVMRWTLLFATLCDLFDIPNLPIAFPSHVMHFNDMMGWKSGALDSYRHNKSHDHVLNIDH